MNESSKVAECKTSIQSGMSFYNSNEFATEETMKATPMSEPKHYYY